MSKPYAHRQIQAAEIAAMVPTGTVPSERVARELAPLKDDPPAIQQARGADRPLDPAREQAQHPGAGESGLCTVSVGSHGRALPAAA